MTTLLMTAKNCKSGILIDTTVFIVRNDDAPNFSLKRA